ncbi:MAG: prepilin-type N-terminal cleavage/methylation domain-containing protein [bacterium]|nr:prepilin-type N-terminal cleavage/methylation domain-containing protein [bacterium]
MLKKIKNKKGFTLVEVLFGISIFVLVVGVLTLFSRNVWIYGSFVSIGLSDANDGRTALKVMTSEIRTTSTANTGVYAIALATASAFTFYSDIDDDGLKEKIRYFLSGSSLQKGIIKPTGSPLAYNAGNEIISTTILNITNTAIFDYYNKNYNGTTASLSFPINPSDVRLVKITITTDKDPNRAPAPIIFSTQISIRNLKDNL